MIVTAKRMSNVDPYKFPYGKKRLEPAGIMIFSCVMAMVSIQIVTLSVQRINSGLNGDVQKVQVDLTPILVVVGAVIAKLSLAVYCAYSNDGNGSVSALAQDHRNDVCTKGLSVIAGAIATYYSNLWWIDPAGAITLSCYIFYTWVNTGREQLQYMVGRSAPPEFLNRLTYIASTHDKLIDRVDTVLAFHYGVKFMCEVHVVLPKDMPLIQAHDIGEALERKIEREEEVERCFVHMDYEWEHSPERKAGGEWERV